MGNFNLGRVGCGNCERMLLHEILGQDQATQILSAAAQSGHLAHALLFEGPSSVGKRTTARALAKALNCEKATGVGCKDCAPCRRIESGNHPNHIDMYHEKTQFTVGQIRKQLNFEAQRSTYEGRAKVLVLNNADKLNQASANAMLKTLEEPQRGNHIVLITAEPDALLTTIRSRSQRVRFLPLNNDTLVTIAVKNGADATRASSAAALCGGSAALTIQFATDPDDSNPWDAVLALRKAAGSRAVHAIFDTASVYAKKETKSGLPNTLSLLQIFYRDVMVSTMNTKVNKILTGNAQTTQTLAEAMKPEGRVAFLKRAFVAVCDAQSALRANGNAVTTVERMMMEMRGCERWCKQ